MMLTLCVMNEGSYEPMTSSSSPDELEPEPDSLPLPLEDPLPFDDAEPLELDDALEECRFRLRVALLPLSLVVVVPVPSLLNIMQR
jgi:hypothetical protein